METIDQGTDDSDDGSSNVSNDEQESRTLELHESDLYKVSGDWLYLQSATTGLNIIDISHPEVLSLETRLPRIRGNAGELYVEESGVFVVFDGMEGRCNLEESSSAQAAIRERSEIVAVAGPPKTAIEGDRYCVPGDIVATRVFGDYLYGVSTAPNKNNGADNTWIWSLDIRDATDLKLVDTEHFAGESREVFVNRDGIFVTQAVGDATDVTFIDVQPTSGALQERGNLSVPGTPAGRFHMDVFNETFRIVTYNESNQSTNLHVINISDPDHLWLMGSESGLAPGEELWATRFVGNRAYVVTYMRVPPPPPDQPFAFESDSSWFPSDPLWVISLDDPANPRVLGELKIPGWSNFIYPFGDQLITVGRGERGAHVAVSLFDISNPRAPLERRRLEFGNPEAVSEANVDFRGVTIIDDEDFGPVPLISVPYTNSTWTDSGCTPSHGLQLIDYRDDDLILRGDWTAEAELQGTIRRIVGHRGALLSISDRAVVSLDVDSRSEPLQMASVDVASASFHEECPERPRIDPAWDIDEDDDESGRFFCNIGSPRGARGGWVVALALLAGLGVAARRRRALRS